MNTVNYAKELGRLLDRLGAAGETPRLLLHSCCGPCSSSVLETLASHFAVTLFYDNPNIHPEEEYRHRLAEQQRLLTLISPKYPVAFREGEYRPERFFGAVRGLEAEPEGGARCPVCFELRLRAAAELAKREGFDYFTTTLSVSPHKDAARLNEIGGALAEELGVKYLFADFKKKDGYLRSIRLAEQYGLYRQDYCGCVYSKRDPE